jgi:hypothetical protein
VAGLPQAVDTLRAYGEDEAHLLAPPTTGPRVGTAKIFLGELFDVLDTAFSGEVNYAPADPVVASGVVRVGDGNGHARVALDVADLLETLDGIYEDVLSVGVNPGLGELGRAVGHRGGDITCTRLVDQRDQGFW